MASFWVSLHEISGRYYKDEVLPSILYSWELLYCHIAKMNFGIFTEKISSIIKNTGFSQDFHMCHG